MPAPTKHSEIVPAEEIRLALRKAPQLVLFPGPEHRAESRAFQGISSIAITSGGSLVTVWYGGKTPAEDHNNYICAARSRNGGTTWSKEILVIDPDGEGPVRAFDPEVWLAPDGRLWIFWSQCMDRPGSNYATLWGVSTGDPDADDPSWSEPVCICEGVMMCKPIVLPGGEWGLPVSFWHRRETGHAGFVTSPDNGATWEERGAASGPPQFRSFDEHMVIELEDGDLWMLVRTIYGMAESYSKDQGRTWSELAPSGIPHVCSRFFITRLQSGKMLLVRHDPANAAFGKGGRKCFGERSHLTAFLSEDDGKTWPHRLLLDERSKISYPDGAQAPDGTIHLTYDFDRYQSREILATSFTEEQIIEAQGAAIHSPPVVVSKATLPVDPPKQ